MTKGIVTKTVNRISIANDEQEFYTYPNGEDSLKYGLIFKKKPATNQFVFKLEGWKDFDFFYQRPWKNYEPFTKDGIEYIRKTDEPIRGSWREPKVQGCYEIFHKTKKNYELGKTNYGIGKFGDIYCPRFIDANGKIAWGELVIKNGVYTVTIPQDFLDTATYPVIANDEYGYNNTGASAGALAVNVCMLAQLGAAPASGTLNYVYWCGQADSETKTYKTAMYSETTGSPATRIGIDTNATTCNTTTQFRQSADDYNLAITAGNVYYAGLSDVSGQYNYKFTDVGGTTYGFIKDDVATCPATWTDFTYSNYLDKEYRMSCYVTYTASSTSPPFFSIINVGD